MFATYVRLGSPNASRAVRLASLPRRPAEVIRLGRRPAALTATPTAGQKKPATALQRVARFIAGVLLSI